MPSARPNHGLNTIIVEALDDPRLAGALTPYRNQKDTYLRALRDGGTGLAGPDGLFMAEGELVVGKLIQSEHRVVSVLVTPARLEAMADALATLPRQTPIMVAERRVIEGIIGFDLHRGVLALGRRERVPSAAEVLDRARRVVVCEDLANHDNVGGIFRNVACLAGEGGGVLLSLGCCDPLYRKSLRVSMGHALGVPFARLSCWPGGLGALRGAGFTVLAATPAPEAADVRELADGVGARVAVLVGAEGPGLTAGAMAMADLRVRIPMAPGADSLNVATSVAVVLSHLAGV
jgi:tRNA G18 (ribose-2'-O)-methylase SpoU